MKELCRKASAAYDMKVRVGGGIRSVARAVAVAGWNPEQIIIGSAAFRDGNPDLRFLERLTRKVAPTKIVIALDTLKGMITTHGWRRRSKLRPAEVMAQLTPYCAAFLCTDVDREGTMGGVDLRGFATCAKPLLIRLSRREELRRGAKLRHSKKSAWTRQQEWRCTKIF